MRNQLLLLSCSVSVLARAAGDKAVNTKTGDELGTVSFPHLLRPDTQAFERGVHLFQSSSNFPVHPASNCKANLLQKKNLLPIRA